MFTGLITATARVAAIAPLGPEAVHGKRITIDVPAGWLDDVTLGDSIAINGACMTVVALFPERSCFEIEMSAESLARTVLAAEGEFVNLEKALRANDHLGGHLVSGHVDGTGAVTHFSPVGESWELRVRAPGELARFLAFKGSITVNGVSLTVNRVEDTSDGCEFGVNLIPHTVAHTTLGTLRPGSAVNLEVDLIARYVERMLGAQQLRTTEPHR